MVDSKIPIMRRAHKLRSLRTKKKWTIPQAAAHLTKLSGQNITKSRYVNWELGRTEIPVPTLILEALEKVQ